MVKRLENFKGVCEDLSKCATKFKDILSYLKVEEGSLKMLKLMSLEPMCNVEFTTRWLKAPFILLWLVMLYCCLYALSCLPNILIWLMCLSGFEIKVLSFIKKEKIEDSFNVNRNVTDYFKWNSPMTLVILSWRQKVNLIISCSPILS